jgi:hypothetical protein
MPNPNNWRETFNAAIAEAVEKAVDEVVSNLTNEGSCDKSIVLTVIEKLQLDSDSITTLAIHRLEQLLNKAKIERRESKLFFVNHQPEVNDTWGPGDYIALSPYNKIVAWHQSKERARIIAEAKGFSNPTVISAQLVLDGAVLVHDYPKQQTSSRKAYRPLESKEQLLRIKETVLLNQAKALAENPDGHVTVSLEDDGWWKVWIQEEYDRDDDE